MKKCDIINELVVEGPYGEIKRKYTQTLANTSVYFKKTSNPGLLFKIELNCPNEKTSWIKGLKLSVISKQNGLVDSCFVDFDDVMTEKHEICTTWESTNIQDITMNDKWRLFNEVFNYFEMF